MNYNNKKQLSPCIIAKAKFSLGIPNWYSGNDKTCSEKYWNKVISILLESHKVSKEIEMKARKRYDLFKRK